MARPESAEAFVTSACGTSPCRYFVFSKLDFSTFRLADIFLYGIRGKPSYGSLDSRWSSPPIDIHAHDNPPNSPVVKKRMYSFIEDRPSKKEASCSAVQIRSRAIKGERRGARAAGGNAVKPTFVTSSAVTAGLHAPPNTLLLNLYEKGNHRRPLQPPPAPAIPRIRAILNLS
ncbi:hypothetical protein EVAR_71186_1 [Eumeta japonica]|uniref:Uncharacterized protein n=1 Tax=Eumeta variegata TaxID=151549 RepID=A0A4C2ABT4_EUMVA|nr:hypothetical protein EVAR_71186_1 [Eumeta japonica]